MSRRHASVQREIIPDAKYQDLVVAKLMNYIMEDGKKSVAENIVYGAFDIMEKALKKNALEVFKESLDNIKPTIEVRSRRVGGATYQVPTEVNSRRSLALSIRWLIIAAKKRAERTMSERLAKELMDSVNNRGAAVKKREETHKMAEANRAFSHYRW